MKTLIFITIVFLSTTISFGQDIKIGFIDSIQSSVLKETRKFIVKLPRDYNNSNKSYPVLYRLDGDINMFIETVGTIDRLVHTDESVPEMIVVMIANTNRNRDMMPTTTSFLIQSLVLIILKNS